MSSKPRGEFQAWLPRLVLSGIVAVASLACSTDAPIPSSLETAPALGNVFAVPWSQERFGAITIFVRDESGLVVGAEKLAEAGGLLEGSDVAAVASPDDSSLEIAWIGGVCRFGPTVTVIGEADHLLVSIQPEAGGELPTGIACDDVGAAYGITLVLTTPVQQDAVTVEVL